MTALSAMWTFLFADIFTVLSLVIVNSYLFYMLTRAKINAWHIYPHRVIEKGA